MTARKPTAELQRPNVPLGESLRAALVCPWDRCRGTLRVVAYRRRTARLECRECGHRFSVNYAVGTEFELSEISSAYPSLVGGVALVLSDEQVSS